jgi:hypothetical protein
MRKKTFYVIDRQLTNFCGHQILSFEGGVFELPYNIKPADGSHNLESCEGCRTQRKNLINKIKKSNKNFPNCCEWHKKLTELREFEILAFSGLEENIADKILYTYHHVLNHIENDDYFIDFTNYYEYVNESFGSFPNNYGSPFQIGNFQSFLIDLVESLKGKMKPDSISKEEVDRRLVKIINYIGDSFKSVDEIRNDYDFKLLLNTYDKWYRTFPFDLSYFKHLKEKYSKTIPILKEQPVYNKYTGLSKIKLKSKEEFAKFLIDLTKRIITNINGLKLYEKGFLSSVENIKLELILKNRQLELDELDSLDNTDDTGYIKYLKFWFETEKKFIEEIIPILKTDIPDKDKKPELTISQIALKLIYEGISVTRENCNEVILNYGHNSGDKLYNEYTYYSSTSNRKGNPEPPTKVKFLNKIKLFEGVIEVLKLDKKERAIAELNIIKGNYNTLYK